MRTLALSLTLFVASSARAGNLDSVFVSDQAAMMGGAVTALASGTTAVFYNPAGLAADLTHTSISISSSSYGIAKRSAPSLIADPAARRENIGTTQLLSVPAAISYFKPLTERLGVGFGLFVPQAENQWQRDAAQMTATDGSIKASFENRLVGSAFHAGGAIGYALTDKLRVGAGLFATYTVATLHLDFDGVRFDNAGALTAVSQLSINDETLIFGGLATLGVQWQVTQSFTLAATLFLPQLMFSQQDRLSQQTTIASAAGAQADTTFVKQTTTFETAGGARLFLGAGYATPKLRLGLEVNVSDPSGDAARDKLWNARAGMQVMAFDGIWLGAGVFTDRSPDTFEAENVLSSKIDYYGATVGVRFESNYLARLVHDWQGNSEDKDSPLLFFTAVTGRYARGSGRTGVIAVDAAGGVDVRGADVTVNELSGQLSTGIAF